MRTYTEEEKKALWKKPVINGQEASAISGIPYDYLRVLLINGKVDFGFSEKKKKGGKRWKYMIFTKKLKEWIDEQ